MIIFRQRFHATFLLWLVIIQLGLAIIGHTQDWQWIPSGLSNIVSKNSVSFSALIIVLLISLITLHRVSEEDYPAVCLYVAGFIAGISFSIQWGMNTAFSVVVTSATIPIMQAGFRGYSVRKKMNNINSYRSSIRTKKNKNHHGKRKS